jgi:phenylacetate-coenzyme A ligase PaaK-like adenylate-forming protein
VLRPAFGKHVQGGDEQSGDDGHGERRAVFITGPATKTIAGGHGYTAGLMASELQVTAASAAQVQAARDALDAHVRETVAWHFDPASGCPFWIEYAGRLGWDPRREIHGFADLKRLGQFEDEWLRGGPVQRWLPRGLAGKPIYVFETGGTTGVPKTRIACDDFRIDYELFSETLPDEHFPRGSNWLMLGPSGPRRLRLGVEHLAQHRGGISFCVDLDPRWVIKLIKKGWTEHLQAYKDHVIDQGVTILQADHDIRCLFTTPKLLEALALRLESLGTTIRQAGIRGIFSGGTEFTPQWNRFAHEELLDGAYMTPTYGNTLMGLAASEPTGPHNGYKITYHAPQPRAIIEVVDFDDPERVVDYGQTGRVKLTTLTREFFMPGFLERDEGEREPPYVRYPWDGVSGVRPYRGFASTTTVGVY